MYLEIKDMKKSFGSGESYNQVLKGITTNIEQGQMCVSFKEAVVQENLQC